MPRQEDRRRDAGPERSVPLSVVKADLFKALAHPARVRVLELLADGEQSVGQMQPLVGVELSHLSQQLGVLRRAGLVTARREGSAVSYAISDPLVVELLGVAKQLLLHSLDATRELLADLSADIASS
jgi:DNA-binding transcriptional ArsR family regulator